MDPRAIIKSSQCPLATVIIARSNQAVFLALQDERDPENYISDFLGIEDTEKVIAALQKAVDEAKAERDFYANLTPEQKREMLDRAIGRFDDAAREG